MKAGFHTAVALAIATLLAPVFAAAAGAPYAHLHWRQIGPALAGGRVAAVAGTDQNPYLYYLGAAGGGVWKSDNGGATWTPVFDKEPVAAIGAVAIDPSNQSVVWVGTGETNPRNDVSYGDGLYRSTNGGKTWARVGLADTRYISRIAIDPKNPNHVVVGAAGDYFKDSPAGGVYVTFDGGKSWKQSLYVGPRSGASDIAMDLRDPNIVFAGIWEFRRQPWTFTSGGPDDGLYRSSDGGKTWMKLTGHGLPAGETGRVGLAIAPSNPQRIYALIEAKGGILWRSDDGGANWKMTSNDTLVDQRPFYFSHIAVDPKNPNHVYGVSEQLSESMDGGLKFKAIAEPVHVDYHAIWIAGNDPKRIIVGEDGGYALTLDEGANWEFSRNIPIGEIYHMGLSNENPYAICGGWQDNSGFCGPSNSLDRDGIKDAQWMNVVGGDGEWAVPDPIDPTLIWTDSQDGHITIFNKKTQSSRFIAPYQTFNKNTFDSRLAEYRFNWDSPVAFAPWDGHIAWYGGNVVFQTTDRGEHWTPISPDLTRNIKEHQQPAGGPLALDVSGAEYSDNILAIEGSRVNKGEIWVGTDDGYVQMTRDGGTTWSNVTPPGAPKFGRVETVSPSPLQAGTAYANFDDHFLGDYRPYLYVTHDYGKTWTEIDGGLPDSQYARSILADDRNPNLVYAGLEQGIYLSYDGGAHWQSFQNNLPQVSISDMRIQPDFDDLVLATHGRAFWIMDDIASLQQLPDAQRAGVYLFKPRTAYEYHYHSFDLGAYTRFTGENPPSGAIVDFYQSAKSAKAPVVEILDAQGNVVSAQPSKQNVAGLNRYVWDFHEKAPTPWMGAARERYRGPKFGAQVVPGTYTARVVLGDKTLSESFEVRPDPRDSWTQADYQAAYDFSKKYMVAYGKIDEALNNLDAMRKSLTAASDALHGGDPQLAAQLGAAMKSRDAIFSTFTADYHNDEDSIQKPGALREDIPRTGYGAQQPPTAATLAYAAQYDSAYAAAFARYNGFVSTLGALNAQLKAKGFAPVEGAKTISP